MRIFLVRWCCAVMLLVLVSAVRGQPQLLPESIWRAEEISLPCTTVHEPLPWVKSPVGPGEFLLNQGVWGEYCAIGGRGYVASESGLLAIDRDGARRIVPAAFGQPCIVVGLMADRLWVQQRGGVLLGLDPETLEERERVTGLAGPCFGVDAASIWCYDRIEMGGGALGVGRGNRGHFATALIEYDRTGKERRRFTADGTGLPKTEIQHAWLDPDAVWVLIQSRVSLASDDGIQQFYESRLLRLDRAGGTYATIATTSYIYQNVMNLPDCLVWCGGVASQNTPARTCVVNVLDKKTLTCSQPARLSDKYASRLFAVQDGKLWCAAPWSDDDDPPSDTRQTRYEIAVFTLDGGRRLHLDEAGPIPAGLPMEQPYSFEPGYYVLGGNAKRMWVTGPGKKLYEIADAGEIRVRDYTPFWEVNPAFTRNTASADVLFLQIESYEQRGKDILKILPGEDRVTRIIGDETYPLAASERRLWFHHENEFITCGIDFKPFAFPSSLREGDPSSLREPSAVAVQDVLYAFLNGEVIKVDGKAGQAGGVDSWRAQAPEELRARQHTVVAFVAPDGRIVFDILVRDRTDRDNPAKQKSVLAAYAPATDTWTFTPGVVQQWGRDLLDTTHGSLRALYQQNTIYRGSAAGWEEAGKLPFCVSSLHGAGTSAYLYLDTAFGLYRVKWDEMLTK